jgi:hypothetical protein
MEALVMKRKGGFAVVPYKGETHWKWNGGVAIINGYRAIKMPDHPFAQGTGYVFEHRLVMEQRLGRHLLPTEKVHHVNGDRTDNRPENLVVLSHRVHLRSHMCKEGARTDLLENLEWLSGKHRDGLNTNEIATMIGCAAHAVRMALDRFGIRAIVSENGHIPQKYPLLHNPDWLMEQTAKYSQREIARMAGCSPRLVVTLQKKFGIVSSHKPGPRSKLLKS